MTDNLNALCSELGLPAEIIAAMERARKPDAATEKGFVQRLVSPKEYQSAAAELANTWKQEENGAAVLRIMLHAALLSRRLYEQKGISDAIFTDTMKCFTRFIREYKESFGKYGFDREYWVGRQLSLLLFRIGTLEYEMTERENHKAISVHIPSDADLSQDSLDSSFTSAKEFFASFYPEYADAEYFCSSWLMYPELKELLSPSSKIIGFQNRFEVIFTDDEAESYKQWVFKNKNLSPEQFPENTSLQRSMKKYILAGGKIGEALGIYKM